MVYLISLAANQPDSRLEPERAGNLLLRPAGAPPSCWASQHHATCGTSGIQSFLSAYALLLFLSFEKHSRFKDKTLLQHRSVCSHSHAGTVFIIVAV